MRNKYSKSTISRITEIRVPEIQKRRTKSLEKSYIAIFMGAVFLSLRREAVLEECVIFAMRMRELLAPWILQMNLIENHTPPLGMSSWVSMKEGV